MRLAKPDALQLLMRLALVGGLLVALALLQPSDSPADSSLSDPPVSLDKLRPGTQQQVRMLQLFQQTNGIWSVEQLRNYRELQQRPLDLLTADGQIHAEDSTAQALALGDWDTMRAALLPLAESGDLTASYALGILRLPDADALPLLQAAAEQNNPLQAEAALLLEAVQMNRLDSAALQLLNAQRWQLAEYLFTLALEADSMNAAAYAYRGYVRNQQGRSNEGLADVQMSLALAPFDALPYYVLGVYWRMQENYDIALDAFTEALRAEPQNPALAAELASTHQLGGDFDQAESWYFEAISLSDQDETFISLLAAFYAEENVKLDGLGLETIQAAVEAYPDNADLHASLGRAYLQLGEYEAAGEALRTAYELAPTMPRVRFLMGNWLEIQNQPLEAITHYFFVTQTDNAYTAAAQQAVERLSR